jgi:hypothetical protein
MNGVWDAVNHIPKFNCEMALLNAGSNTIVFDLPGTGSAPDIDKIALDSGTPPPTTVTAEAETGTRGGAANLRSVASASGGGGTNNVVGNIGTTSTGTVGTLSLPVTVSTAGSYTMTVSFINGGTTARSLKLSVNPSVTPLQTQSPSFSGDGLGWTLVRSQQLATPVTLNAGANTLLFEGVGTGSAPDIDKIVLASGTPPTCTISSIAVAGSPTSVATGVSSALTATVTDSPSNCGTVSWTASPTGGTLTPNGKTASFSSSTAGTYTVTASGGGKTGSATITVTAAPATRNPFLWPFAANSIWNRAMANDATYLAANMTGDVPQIIVDTDYVFQATASSPSYQVRREGTRSATSCNGGALGTDNYYQADAELSLVSSNQTIQGPANAQLIYPSNPTENGPNATSSWVQPNGRVVQFYATCVNNSAVPPYIAGQMKGTNSGQFNSDIKGEGWLGTHNGSGLSSIGGAIRQGELTGSGPIKHALKVTLYAHKYLFNDVLAGQTGAPKFRYPALTVDGYWNDPIPQRYGGTNPNFLMGSLLAIQPSAAQPTFETPYATKIFTALKDYGAYVADDSFCDCLNITTDQFVKGELETAYGANKGLRQDPAFLRDMNKMLPLIYIVGNNTQTRILDNTVARRQPAPPAFQP